MGLTEAFLFILRMPRKEIKSVYILGGCGVKRLKAVKILLSCKRKFIRIIREGCGVPLSLDCHRRGSSSLTLRMLKNGQRVLFGNVCYSTAFYAL